MLRRDPSHRSATPDWELGTAAVLLLIVVLLTTILVPVLA
jgi:hypothetical protein